MPNNIHNIFSKWGKAQRQLPERHEALKSEMLSLLPAVSSHSNGLPWLSFALAGLALLVLVARPVAHQTPILSYTESSQPLYNALDTANSASLV